MASKKKTEETTTTSETVMTTKTTKSTKASAPVDQKKAKRSGEVASAEDVAVGALKLSDMKKSDVMTKFQRNPGDGGSTEVQIALLTRRLESLTEHFSSHPKDHHSRRGMMQVISRRKGLLQYLRRENVDRYRSVISSLGLRK